MAAITPGGARPAGAPAAPGAGALARRLLNRPPEVPSPMMRPRSIAPVLAALAALSLAACLCLEEESGWEETYDPGTPRSSPFPDYCFDDTTCSGARYCSRTNFRCEPATSCRGAAVDAGRGADAGASPCPTDFHCDHRRLCVPTRPMFSPSFPDYPRDAGARPDGVGPRPALDAGAGGPPAIDAGAGTRPALDAGAAPSPSADAGLCGTRASCGAPAAPLCRWGSQCGADGHCENGRCRRACLTDAACGTGATCAAGVCRPSPAPGGRCLVAADCGDRQTCINGFCHAACASASDCTNPADSCDRGLCRPDERPSPQCTSNAGCAAGRLCVDAVCRTPCESDGQCGPGCSGTICVAGFCKTPGEASPACALDVDCGAGRACRDALCR